MSRTRTKHFLHLIWVAALVAVYIYLQLHHQLPNQNGAVTPSSNSPGTPIVTPAAQATAGQSAALGKATKTTGCQVNAALPDPACTPGSIFAGATRDQICQS